MYPHIIILSKGIPIRGEKMQPNGKQIPTKVRVGGVHVSIWKGTNEKGWKRTRISIQRVYRDAEGNWKNTQYLGLNDIPKLILALQKAYEEITLHSQTLLDE